MKKSIFLLSVLFSLTSVTANAKSFELSSILSKRFQISCSYKDSFDDLKGIQKYIIKEEHDEGNWGGSDTFFLKNVVYKGIPVKAIEVAQGRSHQRNISLIFDRRDNKVQRRLKQLPFKKYEKTEKFSGLDIYKNKKTITVHCYWMPEDPFS